MINNGLTDYYTARRIRELGREMAQEQVPRPPPLRSCLQDIR
jgi:hypothetical protein